MIVEQRLFDEKTKIKHRVFVHMIFFNQNVKNVEKISRFDFDELSCEMFEQNDENVDDFVFENLISKNFVEQTIVCVNDFSNRVIESFVVERTQNVLHHFAICVDFENFLSRERKIYEKKSRMIDEFEFFSNRFSSVFIDVKICRFLTQKSKLFIHRESNAFRRSIFMSNMK